MMRTGLNQRATIRNPKRLKDPAWAVPPLTGICAGPLGLLTPPHVMDGTRIQDRTGSLKRIDASLRGTSAPIRGTDAPMASRRLWPPRGAALARHRRLATGQVRRQARISGTGRNRGTPGIHPDIESLHTVRFDPAGTARAFVPGFVASPWVPPLLGPASQLAERALSVERMRRLRPGACDQSRLTVRGRASAVPSLGSCIPADARRLTAFFGGINARTPWYP